MTDELTLEERHEQVNNALDDEYIKWQELGVEPARTVHNDTTQIDAKLNMLVTLLVEKGLISEVEATVYFKERLLADLREHRANVTPIIQKARRDAIVGPGAPELMIPGLRPKKNIIH